MAASSVPRRRLRLLAAVLAGLLAAPAPAVLAAGPAAPGAIPGAGTPTADAQGASFRLDLAEDEDYVQQTNFVRCVGASVQMMINMNRPGGDSSRRTQRRLQELARSLSGPRPDGSVRQGAGVFGWAAALNLRDAGPYDVVGADTLQGAMRIAARAIAEHRRPVGLLVWQGRHAWVMSGFESTGDPRDGSFRVTRAFILDPLYPHGSEAWGPSPRPGTAVSVATVGRQFVRRQTHSEWNLLPGMAELAGKYVLVVPTDGAVPDYPVLPDSSSPAAPPTVVPVATLPRPAGLHRFRIL